MRFINALRRRFSGLGHFRGFGHAVVPIKPYSVYESEASGRKVFVKHVTGGTVYFRAYEGGDGHMSRGEFSRQYRRVQKGT